MIELNPHALVYQALDQVLSEGTIAPGTSGAVFRAIDRLQSRDAPREHVICAENIAIEIHRLRSAISLSDRESAEATVGRLIALAEKWMTVTVV